MANDNPTTPTTTSPEGAPDAPERTIPGHYETLETDRDQLPDVIRRADEEGGQHEEDDAPEYQRVDPLAPVELRVPEFLEGPQADAVQAYLADGLADVAKNAGLSSDVANTLVQLAVDDALGATAEVDLFDRNANETMLRNDWGPKYDERVSKVREFVHRTPGMAEYLERTGLGNSPSVVRAIYLHASGVTTLSKAEAQKQLDAAMKPGSAYLRGDKEAVRQVRALTNIAHAGGDAPERPVAPTPNQAGTLQAERTRLMKSPAFLDRDHAEHKATLARYREVTERLYPERES